MEVDLQAIVHAYASGAEEYARKFGDDLVSNAFDCGVVDEVLAGLGPPALVLDIGCGPAHVSSRVREAGHEAVSIDLTLEMLFVARAQGAASAPVRADFRCLPIASASGAAAICWYSLHHLPRGELPAVLGEVRRTLRIGGRLLIATHGGVGEKSHTIEWQGRSGTVIVTYYAEEELADLVGRAGFERVTGYRRDPLSHEHQVEKLYVRAVAE